MNAYDKQYMAETELFGAPYPEFEDFVKKNSVSGGKALDLGCGQGRDALMLARYGYSVIGVDTSAVGINQMLDIARASSLSVTGVVKNFYDFVPEAPVEAIVLDSVLHFEPKSRKKELTLLNRLLPFIKPGGHLFIFIHKSPDKETALHNWLDSLNGEFLVVKEGYIVHPYEERSINFKTEFQMYMYFLERTSMT